MAALMPQGKQQFFTAGGIPLVGGKVYTYAAGTTTPLATYTTAAASTPNANPVILDSRGEASIFFSAANYKIVVKDSLDSTIWTQDNLPGDAAASVLASLAASTGSSLVGHIASGAGAVATTVQVKLREQKISAKDFGAVGDGTTDDILALEKLRDACSITRTMWLPDGLTYGISRPLYLPEAYHIDGERSSIKALAGFTGKTVNVAGGGITVIDALLIYLLGDYNDIAGAQREHVYVGDGISLNCNNLIKTGIYIERMPYSHIRCRVDDTIAGGNAIDLGPYNWGTHLDGNIVEKFRENAIGIGAGGNGITITAPRIWGNTVTGVSGILVKNGANANGIVVNGGFIEKLTNCAYIGTTNGPIVFNGTDFEVCTNVVRAIGDLTLPAGRKIGPVTLKGCYLDATSSKIYADKAEVIVEGCRLRTGVDFEGSSTAIISSRDNVFENATPSIVAGTIISLDEERTWTPVLWDDTLSSSEGQTYSVAYGTYKRQGNEIHYKGYIAMSSIGTLTGAQTARIGGLPVASSSAASSHSAVSIGFASGLAMAAANGLGGYIGVGVSYINLAKFSATTGSTNLTVTEVSASGLLIFSGFYTV